MLQRDAIKYDPRYLKHTTSALEAHESGARNELAHEHAAELSELLDVLESDDFENASQVVDMLTRLNVAVIVTRKEHPKLKPISWPKAWREREPLARYGDGEQLLKYCVAIYGQQGWHPKTTQASVTLMSEAGSKAPVADCGGTHMHA